jgi:hypothetical protein
MEENKEREHNAVSTVRACSSCAPSLIRETPTLASLQRLVLLAQTTDLIIKALETIRASGGDATE